MNTQLQYGEIRGRGRLALGCGGPGEEGTLGPWESASRRGCPSWAPSPPWATRAFELPVLPFLSPTAGIGLNGLT